MHGELDKTIPYSDSEEAIKKLSKGTIHIIKGGGHNLTEKIEEAISVTVNWFKEKPKKIKPVLRTMAHKQGLQLS